MSSSESSRGGFALGASVALKLGVGFVPIRKDGAVFPGDVVEPRTVPDYRGNQRTLSTRRDLIRPSQRAVLVDDWIETGTQTLAAADLVAACAAMLVGAVVIADEARDEARRELPSVMALIRASELPGYRAP